jgi:hypothetical protein
MQFLSAAQASAAIGKTLVSLVWCISDSRLGTTIRNGNHDQNKRTIYNGHNSAQ